LSVENLSLLHAYNSIAIWLNIGITEFVVISQLLNKPKPDIGAYNISNNAFIMSCVVFKKPATLLISLVVVASVGFFSLSNDNTINFLTEASH
jgi:hypothetical protein